MTIPRKEILLDEKVLPVYSTNTLVIGSGAAGLNAALMLIHFGQSDVLLVTEQWGGGTSFNAGSDKQTYYKLSLGGAALDSPRQMARDLYSGGCMHGDIALCEAQHSAQAFYHLVHLGVPFPHDRYGAYVGYKTDHDPLGRATSAGPLTSRFMCEVLKEALAEKKFSMLDHHVVVSLLWDQGKKGQRKVCGALALNTNPEDPQAPGFVLFNAKNIVLATGGPGGMYEASVYPESQTGSMGLALALGAKAHNLTESQFGLASMGFRWNLSGSYQQVIPRYISREARGGDEREFLSDHFPDMKTMAGAIFRKGYQWPFDAERVNNFGSSLIDLLTYQEIVLKKRKVFLDYGKNPYHPGTKEAFSFDLLDEEARTYLQNSKALQSTPLERLQAMNPQALKLFQSHGIDLAQEPLEIAVCAQHNNGGLVGNLWWESNIRHLFPVGEANGTHGVRRPGGSALNSGQVGSYRAALYIARRYRDPPPPSEDFLESTKEQIRACLAFAGQVTRQDPQRTLSLDEAQKEIQKRMSASGAHIRDPARVAQAVEEARILFQRMDTELHISSLKNLAHAFRLKDMGLTHVVYLETMKEYFEKQGKSRGSALVIDASGQAPCDTLGHEWKYSLAEPGDFVNQRVLEVHLEEASLDTDDLKGIQVHKNWVDIRPIPEEDEWFETLWKDFVKDRVIR